MSRGTVGILAGMGPRSTAPFIDMLVTECQRGYGAREDMDFPHMMIYSLPTPFYADRPLDHAAMERALKTGLAGLERAGAGFASIACNTAHIYYDKLARSTGLQLLNMVELTLDELQPAGRKTALLAARGTVAAGIYQAGLRRRGYELAEPDWQPLADEMIEALRREAGPEYFRDRWRELAARAETAGAGTVIIACMDLSAVSADMEEGVRVLDAGRCLARGIVKQWLKSGGPDIHGFNPRPQVCRR